MQADGLAWASQHKGALVLMMLAHVPKLWLSLGVEGKGLGATAPVLAVYLGALLLLGVAGLWRRRKEASLHPLIIVILVYWALLLPTPEARRTLPLRLPMLLFAASAVAAWGARLRGRKTRARD